MQLKNLILNSDITSQISIEILENLQEMQMCLVKTTQIQ